MNYPEMRYKPDSTLIQAIHAILREEDGVASTHSGQSAKMGSQLRFRGLGFFLDHCHQIIGPSFHHTLVKGALRRHVLEALVATTTYLAHSRELRTSSHSATDSGGSSTNMNMAGFHAIMTTVSELMDAIRQHANRSTDDVAAAHGGLLRHASVRSLIDQVGSAVSKPMMESLFEQLAALHASAYAAQQAPIVDTIEQISDLLSYASSAFADDRTE